MGRSYGRSYGAYGSGVRVLVGAVGVAGLLAVSTACGASASDDHDPENRSFRLPGRTLTVDSDNSRVDLVARGDLKGGEVRVTRWFQGSVVIGSDPRVTWAMDGDRLKLRMRCAGLVARCSARYRVEVPRGIAVTVKDDDGKIAAKGFREALAIHAHDGSVRVTDTSGPLSVDGDDGSVTADVASQRVRVSMKDGSVRLRFSAPPRSVRTSSEDGSTTIEVPRTTYQVRTEAEDGSVRVSVPRDDHASRVIDAREQDGSITVRTVN